MEEVMIETLTLEDVERINQKTTDCLAAFVAEMEEGLQVPERDLALFGSYVPKGGRVLDLGSGAARYAGCFSEQGFRYVGVDLSQAMVAVARRRHLRLPFAQMSYRALKFPDAHFSGVWSCCVLNHEPKRNIVAVLQEVRRVMKDGAPLLNVFPYTGESDEGMGETFNTNLQTYFAHWEVEEFVEVLTLAGFRVQEAFVRYEHGSATFLAFA